MAILGVGYFLCEACKHFDTDGTDGNHPNCSRQKTGLHDRAIPLGQECPFGYEFGVPYGYPVSMERNRKRAYEIKAMLDEAVDRMEQENDCQESYCHLHDGRIEYVRGGRKASLMVYRLFDDNDEDAPEWVQVAWATGRLRVKSPSRFLVSTGQGHLRTGVWGDYIVFDPNNWALSVCPVELARSFGLVSGKEGE